MREVVGLTPYHISILVEYLRKHLQADEPVDDFSMCNIEKLDSSLKTPFSRHPKESFRDDLIEKAGMLFYLLAENHTLPTNGNKRLATYSLIIMLNINSFEISASNDEIYKLAIDTATLSKKNVKHEEILKKIFEFLSASIKEIEPPPKHILDLASEDFQKFMTLPLSKYLAL